MQVPETCFDVVHIQWPEALVGWEEPTEADLHQVQTALNRWSRMAAVVVTVHNEYPHYRDTEPFRTLYKMVYDAADGLVHMGEASTQVVRRRYDKEVEQAKEIVIPHGNYNWFPDEISQQEARSRLGIDYSVVLCIGKLRAPEELRLLYRGFSFTNVFNKRLVIAGRLPFATRIDWRYWALRVPLIINPAIILREGFIEPSDMQVFLRAADVVVVSRRSMLNSGNLYLGFTFGRVVVGPDSGVVGEILRRTGNPVFDPEVPETLGAAIEHGLNLSHGNTPITNATYAKGDLAWSSVVQQHVEFYADVLSDRIMTDKSNIYDRTL
jgi:hypothetical protein